MSSFLGIPPKSIQSFDQECGVLSKPIQPFDQEARDAMLEGIEKEICELDRRIQGRSKDILSLEAYLGSERRDVSVLKAVLFPYCGIVSSLPDDSIPDDSIAEWLKQLKWRKSVEEFERSVDVFIQELFKIAPKMSTCITDLKGLRESAKKRPYLNLAALSKRLTELLKKHMAEGSSEPKASLTCTDIAELLVKQDVDVNKVVQGEKTALTWAIKRNDEPMVRWLLTHGALANLSDGANELPIECSFRLPTMVIADLLVQHGAAVDDTFSRRPTIGAVRPNIYLYIDKDTPPTFLDKVRSSLTALEQVPVGKRLIEKIGRSPHRVIIMYGSSNEWCGSVDGSIDGKGVSSFVRYSGLDGKYLSTSCTLVTHPSSVILGHELIHAYHCCNGKILRSHRFDKLVWTDDEEYHTIMGCVSKNPERTTPKITENAILASLGLPERFSHFSYESTDGPKNFRMERIKLVSELYRRFCLKNHYDGQAHNPPPPAIDVTSESFGTSDKVVLMYTVKRPIGHATNLCVLFLKGGHSLPRDFLWTTIDPDKCDPSLLLRNQSPFLAATQVREMSLYRLTHLEAEALESESP